MHTCAPFCTFCAPACTLHTFVHPSAPFFAHLCTLTPLCAPFCTPPHSLCPPSVHPCTLFSPFSGFVTLIRLSFLTSDPLLATMGNPALVQPGIVPTSRPLYNQVHPLWPPCCPSVFPVGLHNPHSHSRIRSGSHTTHLLGKILTVIPRGL